MSDKLQQAIQATRAGDEKNAQFLLTQAIQEDPDNPQSWYLLSLLIGDKEKKQTYLTKVLDLDPDHDKAHQQLVALMETAVPETILADEVEESILEVAPIALSSDSPDLETQDAGDTLPDWMADDLPDIPDDAEEAVATTAVVAAEEEPVPDWLEESVAEDWDKEETAVDETISDEAEEKEDEQPEEKKEVAVKEKKPAKPQKSSEANLNYLLIGLVVVAITVFIILAYMIFTMR